MGGVEQFISNYYHHSDFTLEAFRDLELTISKDYLQAALISIQINESRCTQIKKSVIN